MGEFPQGDHIPLRFAFTSARRDGTWRRRVRDPDERLSHFYESPQGLTILSPSMSS